MADELLSYLNYPLHLLVYELDASDGGLFQLADLSFDEKLKRDLRDEERRSGSRRVANGREDVKGGQTGQGVN